MTRHFFSEIPVLNSFPKKVTKILFWCETEGPKREDEGYFVLVQPLASLGQREISTFSRS